jgi:hypothetical protein
MMFLLSGTCFCGFGAFYGARVLVWFVCNFLIFNPFSP